MVLVLGISLLVSLVASLPEGTPRCSSGSDPVEYLPHPTDCARYLTCVGSTPIEQRCPDGLEWNTRESTCSPPDVAKCSSPSSQKVPSHLLRTGQVRIVGKCPSELSRCPIEVNPTDDVVFMPHADCRKFYVCSPRGPIELSCPRRLYWNHEACRCDYGRPSEVDCVVDEPQAGDTSGAHIRVRREDVTTTTEFPVASGATAKGVSSVLVLIVTMLLNV
ncbi:AGAP006793-PA-like protein [Anopheles sinensis]|uniref:AGAP006793-PA-like protein n=1 Tax=Anopheles sinensis TaxID=74873 RepID=A0A084WMX8_ANOSI|nr:AGAP006793-PA-like protein [Anopheles sinensis]